MTSRNKESKICATCGRRMEFRKAWAKNWGAVKFCSDRCRGNKKQTDDSESILMALRGLPAGAKICLWEALPEGSKQDSSARERMRSCARKLAAAGFIEILQDGNVVDPQTIRGPVHLRLKR